MIWFFETRRREEINDSEKHRLRTFPAIRLGDADSGDSGIYKRKE